MAGNFLFKKPFIYMYGEQEIFFMEPIRISSLPQPLVDLILSDQKTYNFNDNSVFDKQYLDEEEIGVLLGAFNMTDVCQLYNISDEDVNKLYAQSDEEIEPTSEGETHVPAEEDADIRMRDSARNDLVSIDATSVSLNSPDNTLSAIYRRASASEDLQLFIESVASEIQKIDDETDENALTEENQIVYKDANGNDKVITIKQAVVMGGIFQKEGASDSDDDGEDGDDSPDREDTDDKNTLNGGLHYRLLAKTDDTKFGFQAHIDNTDQDFFANLMHDVTLQNGGKFGITGSGRVTLDQNEFVASGGLALDYNSKDDKFSAGTYGHIDYNSTDSSVTGGYDVKAYVNYNKIGGLFANITGEFNGSREAYIGCNLYGKKSFDNGVSLAGALSADIGRVNMKTEGYNFNGIVTDITARGNISFKAGEDISAKVEGMLVYQSFRLNDPDDTPSRDFGTIVRGNFRKGKTEVYLVGCAYKDFDSDNSLLTGAATFGIQINDLVKKGIAAYIEGTVCNTDANVNPNSSISGIKVGSRLNF